jgi:glycosyltransferase involved in cell wall biosynthesis
MSFLVRLIKNIKPDLIYSQGLCVNYKNLLLPVLNAKRKLGLNVFPKWLYSSWGADLDYYPKISAQNEEEVKRVISECDYLITECDRDRDLAFKFGFKGKYLDKLPAFGGVKLDYLKNYISQGDPSERRIILLKGRDNADGLDQVGRAMVVMNALPYLKDDLKDYEINIFQASSIVKETAAKLEREHKIKIKILEYVPYDELLRIFGRSKIFISFTINDGLPSSLVEAMALGAYPILSDLAPFREWIRNCENGNLIGNNDPAVFVKMMKGALADDSLINRAAKINYQIVKDRLEFDFIKNKYSEILHAI